MARAGKLIDQVIASNIARSRKDIAQWRAALTAAENVERPNRTLLYNLYNELILDADWIKEAGNRASDLKSTKFNLVDASGKIDEEKTKLLKKPWVYDLIDYYMETIHWGHSLLQIGDIVDNEINDITLINRYHIKPEKGLFIVKQGDEKGVLYRQDESVFNWLIEIGRSKDLGILNACAPHILYSRFAQSAWSEYCEIFGMPLRIGKTNTKDDESLQRMEQMLINMATASYGILDESEEIEFVQSNGGKGEVYDNLMKVCTAKIAKIISGAVKGEDSANGSRSKEEVSAETTDKRSSSDKEAFESYMTFKLFPKLIKLGYPLEGYELKFEEKKDLKSLWDITKGLLEHYKVPTDFITTTFGVPVEELPTPKNPKLGGGADFF
jgi:phage gp29-like protein